MNKGKDANPSNGEETNPLDAEGDSQSQTSVDQPEPPANAESLGGALLVLVGEGIESEGGESSRDNEWRVEEDQPSLRKKTVLYSLVSAEATAAFYFSSQRTEDDQTSTHERCH